MATPHSTGEVRPTTTIRFGAHLDSAEINERADAR